MTENEAIIYLCAGVHPGNLVTNAPRLLDYTEESENDFVKAIPTHWNRFRYAVEMWFSKQREMLSKRNKQRL